MSQAEGILALFTPHCLDNKLSQNLIKTIKKIFVIAKTTQKVSRPLQKHTQKQEYTIDPVFVRKYCKKVVTKSHSDKR